MKFSIELIVCSLSLMIFLCEVIFFAIKISIQKKRIKSEGKEIIKPTAAYAGSIVLCCLTILLPVIIPLKIMVITIVCLCGISGTFVVFKDRLKLLTEV